jgi:hypothetical protein
MQINHRRTWAGVFALITLALLAGGYGYYHAEAKRIRQEKYHDIAAIGELKIGQIQQWRQERLADARRSMASPFFQRALAEWRTNPETPGLRANWEKRLRLEQEAHGYANVLLLDPNVPSPIQPRNQPLLRLCPSAMRYCRISTVLLMATSIWIRWPRYSTPRGICWQCWSCAATRHPICTP